MDTAFHERRPWNEGRVLGAKRALRPQQIWAIRFWLDQHRRLRDRALFDLAIDCKLRGCDVVEVQVLGSPDKSIKQLAAEAGQCSTRLSRLVRLSWLAPELVERIANGDHPRRLTPRRLLDAELPACWTRQQALLAAA